MWFGGQRFGPAGDGVQTGLWLSAVITSSVLFAPFGSNWSPAIDAVFVSDVPELPAVTVMSNVVEAPLARLPSGARHDACRLGQPALADTKVEFAGSVSVTATPVAAAGPLFEAARW